MYYSFFTGGAKCRFCSKKYFILFGVVITGFVLLTALFVTFFLPPAAFPEKAIILIEEGKSLSQVAEFLEDENIVRSASLLKKYIIFIEREQGVIAGEYYFEKPIDFFEVAERISNGDYHFEPRSLTIPEGLNIFEIADTIKKQYPLFDTDHFIELARLKEGYLFPDTYRFSITGVPKPEEIIEKMESNFLEKIETIQEEIDAFGRPLSDIVVMASILEEEAMNTESRRIISGILWKRISINMALQVDAAFVYVPEVQGRTTFELTQDDLQVDSPFNTYFTTGLPPHPISNPGLDSLRAAVTPIETEYWFYLSDMESAMHYAKDFEEHQENIERYLK